MTPWQPGDPIHPAPRPTTPAENLWFGQLVDEDNCGRPMIWQAATAEPAPWPWLCGDRARNTPTGNALPTQPPTQRVC